MERASFPLGPLQERDERVFHTLSTVDAPKTGVLHRVIPKFGAKVVDKGIVRECSTQVHLFQKDFSLSAATYFIPTWSSFVCISARGEARMVCLYGTLAPFGQGKAFTLLVRQAARMRAASPHSGRASIPP